jgi:hypothetical protein
MAAGQVLRQFARQAESCEAMGSPFTARLCRVLAERLDLTTRFGRTILEWPGDPFDDNVALRACGALHALKRTGWEPELVAVYPPNAPPSHVLAVAVIDMLQRHDGYLTARLASPPQTNEVARSSTLLGAMLHVCERTGLPLELHEIGASAGLNLSFDRYRYRLGEGRAWGAADAALGIESAWRGVLPPLAAPLVVLGRHGCDLRPVDPANAGDRERLLSYVWADQTHRLERVQAALEIAAAEHVTVEQADAADWLARLAAAPAEPGRARVIFHTVVWQYIPAGVRARIEASLAALGDGASADAPVAHVAMEGDGAPDARLELTIWPGGETRMLGRADFHGRWTEWE